MSARPLSPQALAPSQRGSILAAGLLFPYKLLQMREGRRQFWQALSLGARVWQVDGRWLLLAFSKPTRIERDHWFADPCVPLGDGQKPGHVYGLGNDVLRWYESGVWRERRLDAAHAREASGLVDWSSFDLRLPPPPPPKTQAMAKVELGELSPFGKRGQAARRQAHKLRQANAKAKQAPGLSAGAWQRAECCWLAALRGSR